ncbi:MAG: cobalamin biosynthesis protein CbiX [Proteobacteria bacterium]|nr:cobalamin biosynthesis protein CbiX [Pseudomonadota bacterium]
MTQTTIPPRILLLAHGSRQADWARPFEAVLASLRRARPDLRVELAYLEFMQPTLRVALDTAGAGGCARLDIVPLFLGAGGHLQRDIPQAVREAQTRHPNMDVRIAPAAGECPNVIQALAAYALQCASAG